MNIADFLRIYPLRTPSIMWFLGAGSSAAAGIPTAYDMIWDFKRTLYCAAERISVRACSDLGNQSLRLRIQQYFDATTGSPSENSIDEYAHYFERAYPAEADRRRYIDNLVSAATPSYGHMALAALLKLDRARIVWTTNFDRTVEDAAITLLGSSGKIVMATLDTPMLAAQALNEGRWPMTVKLHGDFQSRRLKNIQQELQAQDAELRRSLVDACRRYGLAVVGYSGRDDSIMDALEEAIDDGRGYPSGLFWFNRSDGAPSERVSDIVEKASAVGIDAHIIDIETFDELLGDVLLLVPDVPDDIIEHLREQKPRVSDAPLSETKGSWPWIRLNALPVLSSPSSCRRLTCKIGGAKEVTNAVKDSGADVIATRRQVGVIAFGSDAEVRKAFNSHSIVEFDLHSIETRRLRYESAEKGLIYDALCHALARERPLMVTRRRSGNIIAVDPSHVSDAIFSKLRETVRSITGTVPTKGVRWSEAVRIRLEYRLERLWLLMEPAIWIDNGADDPVVKEFVRARLAARYNSTSNSVIAAWAQIITGGQSVGQLKAFGIGDGVDAAFTISSATAFSQREVTQ